MNDEIREIVLKAQNGDREAFGQIYNLYQKKIYRFSFYLIQDRQLAEDITQNTFMKAWKALPSFSFKKNGTIQAYLFKIARNLGIDYQRKKREISLDAIADFMPSEENLEDLVVKSERENIVHKALSGLDKDEKQIIVMRYFEELSYAEIAKTIGKNEGAIRVQIHRVLKKLKGRLSNYEN